MQAHEGAQSHKLAFAHHFFTLGVNCWKTPLFRSLTAIEIIRGQLRNLDDRFVTFGGLTCKNYGSVRDIPQTNFTLRKQRCNENCHNLNHYFERAPSIMLSQLECIVLCPVILCAYFERSHGNAYHVIVTQKYSIITFRPFWHNIDVNPFWTWWIT